MSPRFHPGNLVWHRDDRRDQAHLMEVVAVAPDGLVRAILLTDRPPRVQFEAHEAELVNAESTPPPSWDRPCICSHNADCRCDCYACLRAPNGDCTPRALRQMLDRSAEDEAG